MLVGKPIGIVLGVGLAMLVGLHLPRRLTWRDLIPIGFTMAIGFSVGLFFTTALLPPGQLCSARRWHSRPDGSWAFREASPEAPPAS